MSVSDVHGSRSGALAAPGCPAIIEAAQQHQPSIDGLAAVWLKYDNPAADYVREQEALVFPEVPDLLSDEVERQCMFLAIVDVAEARVLHATRVSGPSIRRANRGVTYGSGFVLVDELIEETGATAADLLGRYAESTLDISISIETNFRIGDKKQLRSGARVAHLGYLAIFRLIERMRPRGVEALVLGAQNEAAMRSLGALGIPMRPLSGLPEQRGDSERVYRPTAISATDDSRALFESLEPIALPEAWLGDEAWAGEVLRLRPPQIGAQRAAGSEAAPA